MKKNVSKAVKKQSVKYFFQIVAFITFLMLGRFLWNLDSNIQLYILGIGVFIISVGVVFDLWSASDLIPYFAK